jgi:hypothetical protein
MSLIPRCASPARPRHHTGRVAPREPSRDRVAGSKAAGDMILEVFPVRANGGESPRFRGPLHLGSPRGPPPADREIIFQALVHGAAHFERRVIHSQDRSKPQLFIE